MKKILFIILLTAAISTANTSLSAPVTMNKGVSATDDADAGKTDSPLDDMEIIVDASTSYEFAFTNKKAMSYTGETNKLSRSKYQGLVNNDHKYLENFWLRLDEYGGSGETLDDNNVSGAVIYPQRLVRTFSIAEAREEIFLPDNFPVLAVTYFVSYSGSLTLYPEFNFGWKGGSSGNRNYQSEWDAANEILYVRVTDGRAPGYLGVKCSLPMTYNDYTDDFYTAKEYPTDEARCDFDGGESYRGGDLSLNIDKGYVTFVFSYGADKPSALNNAQTVLANLTFLKAGKRQRLENMLIDSSFSTENTVFDKAMKWAMISMDSLIMDQTGVGIFAGLHWFNNYWGRDTFISFPGAVLCTGKFDEARQILETMIALQDTDPGSETYGRVPNLVVPGTEPFYNTADGTPWFIREFYEYVLYSGDVQFAFDNFDTVINAVEGELIKRTDEHKFSLHDEEETWMDAQQWFTGDDLSIPCSPRGERSVEIQALWYTELLSGAALAEIIGDQGHHDAYSELAETLKNNFNARYWNPDAGCLFDHLDSNDIGDPRIRPNQTFAVTVPWSPLLTENKQLRVTNTVRDNLLWDHGIGSLNEDDPYFFPYAYYCILFHRDLAYHNGDVWVWLSGPVISALTKFGELNAAYSLTQTMTDHILNDGCLGSLCEIMHGGLWDGEEVEAGTVSQAWSLAEYIRVFYQSYAGLKVDAVNNIIEMEPAMPEELGDVSFRFRVKDSTVDAQYIFDGNDTRIILNSENLENDYIVRFTVHTDPNEAARIEAVLQNNVQLKVDVMNVSGGWQVFVNDAPQPLQIIESPFNPANEQGFSPQSPHLPSSMPQEEGLPPEITGTNVYEEGGFVCVDTHVTDESTILFPVEIRWTDNDWGDIYQFFASDFNGDDHFSCRIGPFDVGTTIKLAIRAGDGLKNVAWDNNSGSDYSVTISTEYHEVPFHHLGWLVLLMVYFPLMKFRR